MRILIDILHPAHVHFFRNAIHEWSQKHQLLITSRKKDITTALLDSFGIPHRVISQQSSGFLELGRELVLRDLALLKIAKQFKPDIITGVAGVCAAHVSKFLNVPSVIFYDTEKATLINALTHPFATTVHTPDCYTTTVNGDHRRYPGFHELAYLHPNRFKADVRYLRPLGSLPSTYFILRFVNHNSSHARKREGLSDIQKISLVEKLTPLGKVFISSEGALPTELNKYKLLTKPEVFHHILANARMVIGESATVCSEAAILGVPSVYMSSAERGYISELSQRYGLVQIVDSSDFKSSLNHLDKILSDSTLDSRTRASQRIMLRDKIDLTEYIVNAVGEQHVTIDCQSENLALPVNRLFYQA